MKFLDFYRVKRFSKKSNGSSTFDSNIPKTKKHKNKIKTASNRENRALSKYVSINNKHTYGLPNIWV